MGDALLAAAFVSYAGPFNMEFRKRLVAEKWLPDLTERQIPLTPDFMPLDMLADESSKVSSTCQYLDLYMLRLPHLSLFAHGSQVSLHRC